MLQCFTLHVIDMLYGGTGPSLTPQEIAFRSMPSSAGGNASPSLPTGILTVWFNMFIHLDVDRHFKRMVSHPRMQRDEAAMAQTRPS